MSHGYHSVSHNCSAGAGSLRAGLQRESPPRSLCLRSPSRTSSRCRSASPGDSRDRSLSRSPSWRADEDRQDERSSLDFVSVVATLRSLNELPEASSESHKIRGYHVALEDDDQPASSYHLPVWGYPRRYRSPYLVTFFVHVLEEGVETSHLSGCTQPSLL